MKRRMRGSVEAGCSKHLLASETLRVLNSWKECRLEPPEDHDEQLEFESRWMDAVGVPDWCPVQKH